MVAIWYLVMLAPVIALPILWWNYRRKVREREIESGGRWEQFASAAKTDVPVAPAAVTGTGPVAVAAPPATAAPVPRAVPAVPGGARPGLQFARRARTLDAAQTVVFYLLKNALPDYEVMPQLTLASLLDIPGEAGSADREQRLRGLTQHAVDFVVCNKAMQVVAAIDLLAQQPPATPADFKTRCLAQAGIRYLPLTRANLPKREAVRALILGAAARP